MQQDSASEGSQHFSQRDKSEQLGSPLIENKTPRSQKGSSKNKLKKQQSYEGTYQAPQSVSYKSECQVRLDEWLVKFHGDSGSSSNVRGDLNDQESGGEEGQIRLAAPKDAAPTSKIQSLKQWIYSSGSLEEKPSNTFFDLSRKYYGEKYGDQIKSGTKRDINVRGYYNFKSGNTTDNETVHDNHIEHLSMEVVQTTAGCRPFFKAYECNAAQQQKFVKTIKFYDSIGDLTPVEQIVVDEGIMHENFQCYDTSIVHFGNSILFYKRDGLTHKLFQYDVILNHTTELPGYEISEPQGQSVRYHIMFAQHIGLNRQPSDVAKEAQMNVRKFLTNQRDPITMQLGNSGLFVICQTYQIDQERQMNYGKISMFRPIIAEKRKGEFVQQGEFLKKITTTQNPKLDGLIQYSCWYLDPQTHNPIVIAFDPYYSHQFTLDRDQQNQTGLSTYYANNETQMERNAHNPFLKHQNIHFLIQKENVLLNKGQNKNIRVDQFYHITPDNQYMLIYPNYGHIEQKLDVLAQIAQKHQYNRDPDQEFKYDIDFRIRQNDYDNSSIKNIAHISIDDHKSMNQMKKAEHIRAILQYQRKFTHDDQIVLISDQERTVICVYQSGAGSSGNRQRRQTLYNVELFVYEENVILATPIKHLPHQVIQIEEEQEFYAPDFNEDGGDGGDTRRQRRALKKEKKRSDPEDVNQSYYANGNYRHVVSCQSHIKTTMEDVKDPYLNYTHRISAQEKEEFMVLESVDGGYHSIRIKDQALQDLDIRFEMYNRSTNWYTFFFSMVNDKDIRNKRHTYFAVRKGYSEIQQMALNNHLSIISGGQDITMIVENKFNKKEENIIEDYTRRCKFADLVHEQGDPNFEQTSAIYLIFEKIFDNKSKIDFIPIIYQEKKSIRTHHMLLYDVEKMTVVRHAVILPNLEQRKCLRKTFIGNCLYTITRSSEVFVDVSGTFTKHKSQNVKYQVSVLCYLKERAKDDPGLEEEQPKNPAQSLIDVTEFLVNHKDDQSAIHMIGRKQIFLSQSAQRNRQETMTNLFFLPYFDNKGRVKGTRLVLRENNEKGKSMVVTDVGEQPQRMISMKDQEVNNIYHYQNDLIQFGHQKFLLGKPNEAIQDEYILVVSSQLKQRVYMKLNFENSESYYINQKVISKLLSMQLAKFENFVLNDDFDVLIREEYYQSQELLEGKSINDLCLNHPRYVAIGTEQGADQISSIAGSLAEELCEADELKIDNLKRFGLAEETLIIQMDFNFCTTIRIAMEMNKNQSVKVLMEKVFEINHIKYQDLLKMDLPIFLRQPGVQRLYDFLERDYEEQVEIEKRLNKSLASGEKQFKHDFNNFEDFMNHPDLPPFARDTYSYHVKERYRDYHDRENEVIQEVVAKNPYMTWGVASFDDAKDGAKFDYERNVEVEHSCIDFTTVIVGEKIRGVLEHDFKKVTFNDEELANLMYIEAEENLDFYDLEVVRKIVDFQFSQVGKLLGRMFKVYLGGFVIPFLLSMSVESLWLLVICYTVCLLTQSFFIVFEVVQFWAQRLDYFKDVYNVIQVSQFAAFGVLYAYKMASHFEKNGVFMVLLQTFVLLQSVSNTFYYLRIYEEYGFLLEMSSRIMHKLIPLAAYIAASLIGFSKVYQVLNMGISDPNDEMKDIKGPMFQMLFQTYRSTQGDKVVPSLAAGMADRLQASPGAQTVLLGAITFVWLAQNSWFTFYGVQFLAQLFQAYEELYPKMDMLSYRSKAKFNMENYTILDQFFKQKEFKAIAFAVDKDLRKQRERKYEGMVKTQQKFFNQQENLRTDERKENTARHQALDDAQERTLDTIDDCLRDGLVLRQQIAAITASLKPDASGDLGGRRRCACQRL